MPEPAVVSYTLELDLPEDIKNVALEQGEDPNVTCQLMQQLKDMVYEKGDCNPHRMDDDFLIKFLRARFWKVDNAYKLVGFYILSCAMTKGSWKFLFSSAGTQNYVKTTSNGLIK